MDYDNTLMSDQMAGPPWYFPECMKLKQNKYIEIHEQGGTHLNVMSKHGWNIWGASVAHPPFLKYFLCNILDVCLSSDALTGGMSSTWPPIKLASMQLIHVSKESFTNILNIQGTKFRAASLLTYESSSCWICYCLKRLVRSVRCAVVQIVHFSHCRLTTGVFCGNSK